MLGTVLVVILDTYLTQLEVAALISILTGATDMVMAMVELALLPFFSSSLLYG